MDKRYAFALGETEMDGLVTLDHKKKMMNNAIDGGIRCFGNVIDTTAIVGGIVYFGNEIDTTAFGDWEDATVGNTKPQVGCFVFHFDHGAAVMPSGNARHFDNEIARTGLKVLKGIETEGIKPQVRRSIFSDGSDVTVLVTHFFLADFSLLDHQCGGFGEQPVAGST